MSFLFCTSGNNCHSVKHLMLNSSICSARAKSSVSMRSLDTNCIVEVLSFLSAKDITNFGLTSSDNLAISRYPSLWTNTEIYDSPSLSLDNLLSVFNFTSISLPLRSLVLSSNVEKCNCSKHNYGMCIKNSENCTEISSCRSCMAIDVVKSKLVNLKSLKLENVHFLNLCSIGNILKSSRNLISLDLLCDTDVNSIVTLVANYCPKLVDISFRYSDGLNFAEPRQIHPLLRPDIATTFVNSCRAIKRLRFSHYTIDEDCAQNLLGLHEIEEANFSDNESLSGSFLTGIPGHWNNLKKLIIRDCTELDHDFAAAFAVALLQTRESFSNIPSVVFCQSLELVDFSSQWSFINDSLIGSVMKNSLNALRGPSFFWREDQCEIEGFGVDPESGIEGIDDESDVSDGEDHSWLSELQQDQEIPVPIAVLEEALAAGV